MFKNCCLCGRSSAEAGRFYRVKREFHKKSSVLRVCKECYYRKQGVVVKITICPSCNKPRKIYRQVCLSCYKRRRDNGDI